MSVRDQVELLSSGLQEGDSIRVECPSCRGGKTGEVSLSITRTQSNILYQCFRASCTCSGAIGGRSTPAPCAEIKKRKVWDGSTYELPDSVRSWVQNTWYIESTPPHWYWTPDFGGRIAMSIRNYMDVHRGWVLRSTRDVTPKAFTYIDEGEDSLSWYIAGKERGTLIVEDIPSAVRASEYMNAVALCGTNIGYKRALEIADHATLPIVLALDNDATLLSFKWLRKYALIWENAQVLPLQLDVKNMKEDDLRGLLSERETCISEYNKG